MIPTDSTDPIDPTAEATLTSPAPVESFPAEDGPAAVGDLPAGEKATPPGGPTAPPPSTVETGREVLDELARLRHLFDQKILRDQSLQGIVNRLHDALQDAQADLALKFLRPVFRDLIALHDDLVAKAADDGPAKALLDPFLQDVDDLLDRQGVEPYSCPGDRVDPSQQTVKRTRPASYPEDAGLIDKRLRPGFRYGKVILRPEEVVALGKPTTTNADRTGGTNP